MLRNFIFFTSFLPIFVEKSFKWLIILFSISFLFYPFLCYNQAKVNSFLFYIFSQQQSENYYFFLNSMRENFKSFYSYFFFPFHINIFNPFLFSDFLSRDFPQKDAKVRVTHSILIKKKKKLNKKLQLFLPIQRNNIIFYKNYKTKIHTNSLLGHNSIKSPES